MEMDSFGATPRIVRSPDWKTAAAAPKSKSPGSIPWTWALPMLSRLMSRGTRLGY